MHTVLITGGTGLIGRALTDRLLLQGYKVIILTRSKRGKEPMENISYALWNIKEQEIDIEAIRSADFIIHLAGAGVVDRKWSKAYKKEIADSRTESSRLILNALKNNDHKVKVVVSASAIGWYGADTGTGRPFVESDTADKSFLGRTCKLWEESTEPAAALGIRLVKLRTGIVLSNSGGALAAFKKPIRFGMAAILGSGKQIISWVHIDDLCSLFIHAVENENLRGSYNAVAPQPVSNKILTVTLAKKMNGNFYIPLYVPAFVLKLMMGQRSIEVLKSTTVSCEKILVTGFKFRYTSIDSAIASLVKK